MNKEVSRLHIEVQGASLFFLPSISISPDRFASFQFRFQYVQDLDAGSIFSRTIVAYIAHYSLLCFKIGYLHR